MNIDFPPPSKGTYNNAGSSRKLCNYCEHEDMERMVEKSEYAVTSNELKNQFDIPIQLFLSCIGYQ